MPEDNEAIGEESPDLGATSHEENEAIKEETDGAGQELSQSEINWKEANKLMAAQREQIQLLQGQLHKSPKKEKSYFGEKDDSDIPKYSEIEEALKKQEQVSLGLRTELEATRQHPDVHQIVEKYGKQLPQAVAKACLQAEDPWSAAYEACINSAAYYKDQNAGNKKSENAAKAKANMQKPGSASQAGTSGVLSEANKYLSMSEEDLLELANKYALG